MEYKPKVYYDGAFKLISELYNENEELINQAAHTLFWLELNFPLKNGNLPLKFKMKFLKT